MKHLFTIVCLFLFYISGLPAQTNDQVTLCGPCLGQKQPGMIPEIFAPGFISTEKNELNSVFSIDGTEFYYTISEAGKGYSIFLGRQKNGIWTAPEELFLSDDYSDTDYCPMLSPDGKYFSFTSK